MQIIHHDYNNTDICIPSFIDEKLPHVVEIGHSYPVCGYKSNKLYRNSYVIHYIISGTGKYQGQVIKGPCAFLETPQNVHYYTVTDDPQAPQWEQYWIMFSGNTIDKWLEKAKLPNQPIVFPCPYIIDAFEILKKLQSPSNYSNQSDYFYMLSGLLELFSLHRKSHNQSQPKKLSTEYARILCNYIHEKYAEIKSEDDLAKIINVSARHMHKIFKQEIGIPPISYLNNHRIKQAKNMLIKTNYSIIEISEAIGFSSANYFCVSFQKHCDGLSPSEYRKKHLKS